MGGGRRVAFWSQQCLERQEDTGRRSLQLLGISKGMIMGHA
jgi:hypothetical protein